MTFCIGPMLSSEAEVAKLENRRDPNILVMLLARQYRNERNFWLALFTLSSWAVLWIVYQVRLGLLWGASRFPRHEYVFPRFPNSCGDGMAGRLGGMQP